MKQTVISNLLAESRRTL